MYESYKNILNYIGLEYKGFSKFWANSGDESMSFMLLPIVIRWISFPKLRFHVNAEILKEENEEFIYKRGIEVGHIFKLGSKYSDV